MKNENFNSGFLPQYNSMANHGYQNNELLYASSPAVRVQVLLNGADPVRVVKDSSQQVRFTAVNELEKILSCTVPKILFDENNTPYIVSTPEREALQVLSHDISPMVHISAQDALNRIKEMELKETVSLLLKQHGLYDLALSLGMDFNNSLLKKLIGQEIYGLPTDKELRSFCSIGKAAYLVLTLPMLVWAMEEKEPEVTSDFEVIHNGTGFGKIGITGDQKAEYDLQIKIASTGVLSQSTFVYSIDGGTIWSEEILVPLSGYYVLGNSGLTINFYLPATENALFQQNDLYECDIPDPLTSIVIRQEGNSDAEVLVISNHPEKRAFDVLEQLGSKIQVKILKSGGLGTAVWQVSKDNGATWSDQAYAEEKLLIVTKLEESLILQFITDSSNGVFFEKDDMYTIYAERTADNSAGAAIMIIAALVGIFVIVLYFGNKKLKAAIPTELDYEIRK